MVSLDFFSSTRCIMSAISSFNSLMFWARTFISSSLAVISSVSLTNSDSISTSLSPSTGGILVPLTAVGPDPFLFSIAPRTLSTCLLLPSISASFVPRFTGVIVSAESPTSAAIVVVAPVVVITVPLT